MHAQYSFSDDPYTHYFNTRAGHTPRSPDGAAYRFIVRGTGRFGNGARSGRPNEVVATTRREAELKRLHAVATSIALYLEERIAAETDAFGAGAVPN